MVSDVLLVPGGGTERRDSDGAIQRSARHGDSHESHGLHRRDLAVLPALRRWQKFQGLVQYVRM